MHAPEKIELHAGTLLGGKYILDRMIGKGGMGVVWAGTNERTGKRVALKVLRRSLDPKSESAKLFLREAAAAGRVNHPNVVTVFDIIDHEQMTCIVMELLDGEPLNEYLAREGRLSMEKAAALLLPAMRGVAAANAQGVIHRDLKPHNIFLCMGPDGRLVTAKVLDFGNSLLIEGEPGSPSETAEITPIGTPAYMAPEHITGSTPNDQRVDVYGFGVVLFEALAGQHPFPGPPGRALLSRILNEPPLSLGTLRPDLPREVVQSIERAMAKDPNQRFPNLDPLIRLLEEHLLPGSTLPRSMTPLAGVPAFPLVESHSGVADTVVQVPRRTDAQPVHETRPLSELGEENPGSSAGPARKTGSVDRVSADGLPTSARSLKPLFRKPVTRVVLFGGLLLAVVWLAFPMPAGKGPGREPNPPIAPTETPTPTERTIELARPTPEPLVPANRLPARTLFDEPAAKTSIPDRIIQALPGPRTTSRPSEKNHSKHTSVVTKPPLPALSSKPDGAVQGAVQPAAPAVQAEPKESPTPVPAELLSPNLDSPSPQPVRPRAPSPSPAQPAPLDPNPPGNE